MKKEDLIALGIEEKIAKSVMALHGKTVTQLKAQVATAEQERDQLKEQIDSNQAELDTLKESAEGNEELSKQLADLQGKFDTVKAESDAKLEQQQRDFAIKLALKDTGALDENIVLGLLDKDTIKVSDEGLKGLNEQLEALKSDKGFLFQQEPKGEPTPKIVAGGNPSNGSKDTDVFASAVNKFI